MQITNLIKNKKALTLTSAAITLARNNIFRWDQMQLIDITPIPTIKND